MLKWVFKDTIWGANKLRFMILETVDFNGGDEFRHDDKDTIF